jgi:hypothetical protein
MYTSELFVFSYTYAVVVHIFVLLFEIRAIFSRFSSASCIVLNVFFPLSSSPLCRTHIHKHVERARERQGEKEKNMKRFGG